MSEPEDPRLFREQALAHKRRALYGEVILTSSVSSWVITALICAICGVIIAALWLVDIQTNDGAVSLLRWLQGAR